MSEKPTATSISEGSASTDAQRPSAPSASSPSYVPRLPNFCNLGVMLRLLILLNVLLGLAALVRAPSLAQVPYEFLILSSVAQPAIIASLLMCCGLTRLGELYPKAKLAYWRGVSVIFALESVLALGFIPLLQGPLVALGFAGQLSLPQTLLLFWAATAIVLFYFDLRARSLSPALVEARLQALQARIRPHFLFNSINAVLSLIRAEPRRAERMLEDMSELFRVLMADNRRLRPLADEIELCRQYLNIEHIRLGDRLKVVWNIDDMPSHALVPPLILQPLIENAVYHGVEPNHGAGEVVIDIHRQGRRMLITLANPFHVGSTHVSGNRMAIANIKERLQLHFDAEAELRAETRDGRYIVSIHMPIQDQQS